MEILLKHFSQKFSILRNIFDKISSLSIPIDDILSKLNDIEMRFALTTSPLQLRLLGDDINRSEIISDFDIIINTENFLSDINNIFIQCIHILY